MKGVTELLDFLKTSGKKLAVASSTRLEQVKKNLGRNGLDGYFDVVIGGDMVKASKPAPDIYLEACRRLSVKPENAAGIEDSFNGIRSVAAAGMLAVMIPDMVQPDEEIKKVYDRCFESLEELKDFWEAEGI
ncbi:MAG: HAD family hydrolase, partial [Eisenbergiella sp.]